MECICTQALEVQNKCKNIFLLKHFKLKLKLNVRICLYLSTGSTVYFYLSTGSSVFVFKHWKQRVIFFLKALHVECICI